MGVNASAAVVVFVSSGETGCGIWNGSGAPSFSFFLGGAGKKKRGGSRNNEQKEQSARLFFSLGRQKKERHTLPTHRAVQRSRNARARA
jgi:hypothetical protein